MEERGEEAEFLGLVEPALRVRERCSEPAIVTSIQKRFNTWQLG